MNSAIGKSMVASGAVTSCVIPIRRVYPAGATDWDRRAPIPAHEPPAFGRCQPTTHRAVRSVFCPPPHHPQEWRAEPPRQNRHFERGLVAILLLLRSPGERPEVLNRVRGRPPRTRFSGVLLDLPWSLRHRLATPSAEG